MKQNNINYLIPEGVSIGVYKITAPDGHYYIGSSSNLHKRITRHFKDLVNNKHHTRWFQRIYNAHPSWVWTVELLQEVVLANDWLLLIEQEYLDVHYNTIKCMNANPYAFKPPSGLGKHHSIKTRNKIGAALRGRIPWNKNKICPSISATLTGKPGRNKGKKYIFTHTVYGTHHITGLPNIIKMFPELKLNATSFRFLLKNKTKQLNYKGWRVSLVKS